MVSRWLSLLIGEIQGDQHSYHNTHFFLKYNLFISLVTDSSFYYINSIDILKTFPNTILNNYIVVTLYFIVTFHDYTSAECPPLH